MNLLKQKRWRRTILLGFVLLPAALKSQTTISINRPSEDTLFISMHFPEPGLFESSVGNNRTPVLLLPAIFGSVLIVAKERSIHVEVTEKKIETRKTKVPVFQVEDVPIGTEKEVTDSVSPKAPMGDLWEERYMGLSGDKHAFLIGFYPCRLATSGDRYQWVKELTLKAVGKAIEPVLENDRRVDILRSLVREKSLSSVSEKPTILSQGADQPIGNLFPRLKIFIDHEGVFRLSHKSMSKAGLDLTGMDPRLLRIVGPTGEIPIRIQGEEDGSFDDSDAIEFWGEPLWDTGHSGETRLDVFATQNVYWLALGEKNGLRLAQEEGWPSESQSAPLSYLFTQHEEKDSYFHRLPYAIDTDEGDHWFTSSPIVGGEKREFSFDLNSPDNYASQLVAVRVKCRGQSASSQIHSVEMYVNERKVIGGTWQGNQEMLLESPGFSPTYLKDGKNQLIIMNRSEEGELAQLLLDWFEITYPRLYKADDNYLRFRAPPFSTGKMCRFEIRGFTSSQIELYKKGISRIFGNEIVSVTDSLGQKTYTVIFQDRVISEETEYIAVAASRKAVPDSVAVIPDAGLRSSGKGADYIMITPSDSLGEESLRDLIDLRKDQGLQVEVVNLNAIYDTFNGGIPNPVAIRRFLRYARSHWSPPPRYVLLVGDGTYNNRAAPEQGNLIPVVHFQTVKYGAAASDHWYALLDGDDGIPDVAIGRLPVRTRTDLQTVVNKIVDYEKNAEGLWRNRYLLIGAGGRGGDFYNQSESLIQETMVSSLHPERLYLGGSPSDPNVGGTEDLLRHFREGVALMNFRGHGGGAVWADAGLLDLDDVPFIENKGRLPVVTSMTCFTADFVPSRKCLGEALFNQQEVGAVAFWGATGVGWLWNDYYLLQEFFQVLSSEPDLTLGEMLMRAKTAYLLTYSGDLPLSEVYQYTLLGDPALRLTIPKKEIAFALAQQSFSTGDSLHVEGIAESENVNALFEVTGRDRTSMESHAFTFQASPWKASFPIPQNFTDAEGGVRAYVWNSHSGYHAHGFVPFSFEKAFFDSLKTIPERPCSKDSIYFSIIVEDPKGLDRLQCHFISPYPDSLEMVLLDPPKKYASSRAVGPFPPGTQMAFFFLAENREGAVSKSDTMRLQIQTLPDLGVQSVFLEGEDRVFLKAKIQNWGGEPVSQALVRFACSQISFTSEDTVSLEGHGDTEASVPFSPFLGEWNVAVAVDPDSAIFELNRANNRFEIPLEMDRFNVTTGEGTWSGFSPSDTVGLAGKILCFLPAGAVPQNTVLRIRIIESSDDVYSGMTVKGSENVFQLSLAGFSETFTLLKSATLFFPLNSADTLSSLKPYRWDAAIRTWVVCPFEKSDSTLSVRTETLGFFRVMRSEDTDPPWIEIQVENQPFVDGSYVPRNPSISILIQDASGVDIRQENMAIFLDGEIQPVSSFTLPDSSCDPTHLVVSFRPQLAPMEHTLSVKASDVHGNVRQSEEIHFRVASQFEIQYLGNHPNPFKKETIFVYVLTDVARLVSLKIYTVSGKLIRSFERYHIADYDEIAWDGQDDWGNDVANGVYFFRLMAEGSDIQREVTGKIAKIR